MPVRLSLFIPPTSAVLPKIEVFLKTTAEGLTGSQKCTEPTNTKASALGRAAKKKPGGAIGAHPTYPPPTRHETHAGAHSTPGTQTQP